MPSEHSLSAANQQLLLKLPVIVRGQFASLHLGNDRFIPKLVLEQGLAEHRGTVHGGEQVAFSANDRIQLFADQRFSQWARQGFGSVAFIEDELLRRRDVWRDASLLDRQQIGAGSGHGCWLSTGCAWSLSIGTEIGSQSCALLSIAVRMSTAWL